MQKSALGEGSSELPQYPIDSVDNALKVILMFAHRKSIRLTDVSAALGVAHSTAHRLTAMLVYRGFIAREPDSKLFVAGPALLDIGLAVVRSLDLRTVARPSMERLARAVGETVHLAVREGSNVRFLDAVESDRALRVSGRTGRMLPAHATSVGKALLAELDDDALRELLPQRRLESVTEATLTTMAGLRRELERVRAVGYARNSGESEEGVGSIGMVVRKAGVPAAAMSIAVPLTRLTDDLLSQWVDALREATTEVGDRLG
ncbi:IclR family transcriptional regulator [Jiangella asiatica]|uniref:IclR family transcriptional regulator n=1 Tax=Jiangella asiatica TaxID=2530372 RepID=A0A4R5DJJ1_9ACTN|nr:IclR family transcriptional regulator [Jiangella asiatica]TDE14286.1 IclR family transcriptional regulator [Jiangella asiatica]